MPLLAAMQPSMHLSRASSPLPKKSAYPWWTVSEKCKMEDNHTHHICEEVSKIQLEQPGKFDEPPDDSGHGPVRASFRDLAQNCSNRPHAPAARFPILATARCVTEGGNWRNLQLCDWQVALPHDIATSGTGPSRQWHQQDGRSTRRSLQRTWVFFQPDWCPALSTG